MNDNDEFDGLKNREKEKELKERRFFESRSP
jgi:hypothetical protein